MMYKSIQTVCDELVTQFDTIPQERKQILEQLSAFIRSQQESNKQIQLMYVCTHNSRRSHFGQIWAAVAASYFQIQQVTTFSGGTEATAFHPNAIQALAKDGFIIEIKENSANPIYQVKYGNNLTSVCFSKVYDDISNPTSDFAAIMTCSDADENCPFIPGVALRIGTTYEDPKAFDGTPLQATKYLERSHQIALECLYVFSKINA